jgi:tetratricopeptide (TPR) repeat protein
VSRGKGVPGSRFSVLRGLTLRGAPKARWIVQAFESAVVLVLLLLPALQVLADDKWVDEYDRGVAAVRAKSYEVGAEALQHAIAQMPNEGNAVRVRHEIIVYVPHFWLGIARLNLGDADGALREWRISEEQGVVQNTIYYSQMREWVARAQSQKQRNSENAAAESRKAARAALDRALSMQMDAMSKSGDRTDSYRAAKQKLQEAADTFKKAGTDVRVYQRVAEVASQAGELFAAAAEEGKRQRARPPAVAQKPPARPTPQEPTVNSVAVVVERSKPVGIAPAPVVAAPLTPSPVSPPKVESPPVESEAMASARIAVQHYKRRLIDARRPTVEAEKLDKRLVATANAATIQEVLDDVTRRERELTPKPVDLAAKPPMVVPAPATVDASRVQLASAYRAFASGNFDTTERILNGMLASKESADALMLRGCARYTRAILSRKAAGQLADARTDFRSALKLDGTLRLDRNAFSPKLVAFFDQVKSGQ